MFCDVLVSTTQYIDLDQGEMEVSCLDEGFRDPSVVLNVAGWLHLHFSDPAVLARFAAAVGEARGQLDAALLGRVQSPLPVDIPADDAQADHPAVADDSEPAPGALVEALVSGEA